MVVLIIVLLKIFFFNEGVFDWFTFIYFECAKDFLEFSELLLTFISIILLLLFLIVFLLLFFFLTGFINLVLNLFSFSIIWNERLRFEVSSTFSTLSAEVICTRCLTWNLNMEDSGAEASK